MNTGGDPSARRVLIYRLGSLGDTIVALPCFHAVRRQFPAAKITVLTNVPIAAKAAPIASILEHTGLFDDVIEYPLQLREFSKINAMRKKIRAQRFDVVVDLAAARRFGSSLRDYVFFRACGIKRIIGVPLRKTDLVLAETAPGLFEAESIRLARRLSSIGKVDLSDERNWDLCLTDGEIRRASELIRDFDLSQPFLAIGMGTKVPAKDWGAANWERLLSQVTKQFPSLALVAVGSDDERSVVDKCASSWTAPVANLCGRISPRVSAAIMKRAALFIGNDSGPMHLAAAVGTPCVALFSAQSPPGQWYPRGNENIVLLAKNRCESCVDPCKQINGKCILAISAGSVFAAVRERLAAHASSSGK